MSAEALELRREEIVHRFTKGRRAHLPRCFGQEAGIERRGRDGK
jgi:hypothetical protein